MTEVHRLAGVCNNNYLRRNDYILLLLNQRNPPWLLYCYTVVGVFIIITVTRVLLHDTIVVVLVIFRSIVVTYLRKKDLGNKSSFLFELNLACFNHLRR